MLGSASRTTATEEASSIGPWTYVVIVVFSLVLLGFDPDNARQTFSDPLASSIDKIDQGSQIRPAAVLLLAAWAVVSLVRNRGRKYAWSPIVALPFLSFIAMIFLSPLWALDPSLTTRRVAMTALILLGALALARETTPDGLARLTLVVSSVVVAVAVVAQLGLGPVQFFDGEWRLAGLFHPVALSWYCCLGALASVYLTFRKSPLRWAYILLAPAFAVALLLTRTRTGIAALCAGLLILAYFQLSDRRRLFTALSLLVVGLSVFGVVLAGAVGLSWSTAYADIVEVTSLGRQDAVAEISTFTGRLPVWETSLALAEQRPILGFGYNAFSSSQLLDLFASTSGWVPSSSHSGFVDSLLSLGIVGATAFGALVAAALGTTFRSAALKPEVSLYAALVAWLLVNLFVESSVIFEANFVSFLMFTVLIQLAFFNPRPAALRAITLRRRQPVDNRSS